MLWGLDLSPWAAAQGDRLLNLLAAWHSTPIRCQDQLVSTLVVCLGTQQDRSLVWRLELALVVILVVGAFAVGRLTAGVWIGVTLAEGDSGLVVRVAARRSSRFSHASSSEDDIWSPRRPPPRRRTPLRQTPRGAGVARVQSDSDSGSHDC